MSVYMQYFKVVCVCVAVRLCSYHHYLSQYPHVQVLITLSMSDEGSQAAESRVDLFRLLRRPHSEISPNSAEDLLQGKIIGSQTALQAAINAHLIIVYQMKMHIMATAQYACFGSFSFLHLFICFAFGQRYLSTLRSIQCNVGKLEALISLYCTGILIKSLLQMKV